jgi:hypothetical protein
MIKMCSRLQHQNEVTEILNDKTIMDDGKEESGELKNMVMLMLVD